MSSNPRAIVLFLSLALLWWLLSDGELSSWPIGLPAVLAATWAAWHLGTGKGDNLSLSGLLRFLPFFLRESMRGGIDVASRVLGPRVRVAPTFITFPTRLRSEGARLLFVNTVSLLPGTLAADIQDEQLQIHALDGVNDFSADLRRLEAAVGRIYGESL